MAGKRSEKKALVRSDFTALLTHVKSRIQAAQTRAVLSVNSELVRLYWDIGQIIDERQQREGWARPSFRDWPANCTTNCRN